MQRERPTCLISDGACATIGFASSAQHRWYLCQGEVWSRTTLHSSLTVLLVSIPSVVVPHGLRRALGHETQTVFSIQLDPSSCSHSLRFCLRCN